MKATEQVSRELRIERDDSCFVQQVIVKDHYLHRWPSPLSMPFGYHLVYHDRASAPDGRPWGVVVMKKPQHLRQTGLFGYESLPTHWQVLDLARVWIHPALQGKRADGHALCTFSQMVGLALRRVQRDWLEHHPPVFPELPYQIEIVISYCELAHHDGTAYRASGFQRWGVSSDGYKEVYVRRLRAPLKRWAPTQTSLFEVSQ